ncbi:hypothetical protein Tco_0365782 [Tanacetum coccineum]
MKLSYETNGRKTAYRGGSDDSIVGRRDQANVRNPLALKVLINNVECLDKVLDINLDRVEDMLMHQKLLVLTKDAGNQSVFHVRLLEVMVFRLKFCYEFSTSL